MIKSIFERIVLVYFIQAWEITCVNKEILLMQLLLILRIALDEFVTLRPHPCSIAAGQGDAFVHAFLRHIGERIGIETVEFLVFTGCLFLQRQPSGVHGGWRNDDYRIRLHDYRRRWFNRMRQECNDKGNENTDDGYERQ